MQAARCEHTAVDTALSHALQVAGKQLRAAQEELQEQQVRQSTSRQELLRSQEAASHRATLLPPAGIAPDAAIRDRGSPCASEHVVPTTGSSPCFMEGHAEPHTALAAVARAFCEAREADAEELRTALAPATPAAAHNASQQAPSDASTGEKSGPVNPLERAQALSEVLAWRSLQMQIGYVADAVSCLQSVPLLGACSSSGHAQPAGVPSRSGAISGARSDAVQPTGAVGAGTDVISKLRKLNCGAPRPAPSLSCRTSTHEPIAPAWPQLPCAVFRFRQLSCRVRARTASWARGMARKRIGAGAGLVGPGSRLLTAPGPRPTRCPLPETQGGGRGGR